MGVHGVQKPTLIGSDLFEKPKVVSTNSVSGYTIPSSPSGIPVISNTEGVVAEDISDESSEKDFIDDEIAAVGRNSTKPSVKAAFDINMQDRNELLEARKKLNA